MPQVRQWGTGRVAKGLRSESYDVENLKYESTLEVDRDEIADDQTGAIRIRIQELAARAATHKDYLIAQLLINGATAGYNSYDGFTFFNDAHVSGASGSQDNDLTYTAADADNPTSAESRGALSIALTALLAFKDDLGEPMSQGASGLVCVIPPSMLISASEAINASAISATDNVLKGAAQVRVLPWLTATDTWYLCKTDGVVRPFIFQDREPIEFSSREQDSDEGFLKEKFLYGVRARYCVTYGYWQHAIRTVFEVAA